MNLEILQRLAGQETPLALCTVLQVKGSAPRHAGSWMLAGPGGLLAGSTGGGRGEALVLEACREALETGAPRVLEIEMQGLEAQGPDMVCGGSSRILVEPVAAREPYRRALELLRSGRRALLAKRLSTGEVRVVEDPAPEGIPEGLASRALASGAPALEGDLFLHPLLPREKLLILGGGHVGRALAALAPGLGFQVTVGDDREGFLDPARFPGDVERRSGSFTDIVAGFPFDEGTYVVIVTRGHLSDLECVRAVLPRPSRYVGFMGSRRKTRLVLEQAVADGHDRGRVEAICAPIGLEIGAETPEELAVAIAGELIAVRRAAPCLEDLRRARASRRAAP